MSFLQGAFEKCLNGIKLLGVLSLLVVNSGGKLISGVLSLFLDECKLFLVEIVLVFDGVADDLFQIFELVWNALSLIPSLRRHNKKLVAFFLEDILAPNLDILL